MAMQHHGKLSGTAVTELELLIERSAGAMYDESNLFAFIHRMI